MQLLHMLRSQSGTLRHFAAARQLGRFRREADINPQQKQWSRSKVTHFDRGLLARRDIDSIIDGVVGNNELPARRLSSAPTGFPCSSRK
jgi:hypothetical protein